MPAAHTLFQVKSLALIANARKVERLWRSVKYEEVYLKAYRNGSEARRGIDAYLDLYNRERPHQALGYRTPAWSTTITLAASCCLIRRCYRNICGF